jgi:uncharacterized protein YeaO (DUF488 family)
MGFSLARAARRMSGKSITSVGSSAIREQARHRARETAAPEAAWDIHLKRIYDLPSRDDGARVLIDRLWPRGIRKEDTKLTLWLKEIAPSPALRAWFGHDPARFGEFSRRYRAELMANGEAVGRIDALLKKGRVTLLYAAHDPAHNQAVVLADYLRKRGRKHEH